MSEGAGAKIVGLETFLASKQRGRDYSVADLDDAARNFDLLSSPKLARPYFRVPFVIGHSESQEWLADSGLPSWGWVSACYRRGKILLTDLEDVAEEIAALIRARRYVSVSAEFYDDPPEGCPGRGLTLRRVAALGGDLPQVKGMASIPMPVRNSENSNPLLAQPRRAVLRLARIVTRARGFVSFSEVRPMPMEVEEKPGMEVEPEHDREELVKKLGEHGMDTDVIDEKTPDHVLAETVRCMDAKDEERPVHPMDEEEWEEPGEDEEKMQEYRERIKRYSDRLRRFREKFGEADASPDPLKKDKDMMKMSDVAALVRREVTAALKSDKGGTIAELRRFQEETVAAAKKDAVTAFCESQAQAGRLSPVEYKPKAQGGPGGPVYARLMRADSRDRVIKFTEKGGKVGERTELDEQMAEIEKRPTRFGEIFKQPKAHGSSEDLDRVTRFSESAFLAPVLKATGKTAASYVADFEEAKKKNPALTAAGYGVPSDFPG